MNDITPKEAIEILRYYTDLGYGIVIEGEDTTKIKQALSLASKTLAHGTPYNPTGECISREALIKTVEKEEGISWDSHGKDDLCVRKKYIDNAPTVELERPKGVWTFDEKGYFYCDQCGKYPRDQYATTDFCPKCGADMKGGAE